MLGVGYLLWQILHRLPGQPILVSEKKPKTFLRNFLCFNLWPLSLVLSLNTTEKNLCWSLIPFIGYLQTLIGTSWAFSVSRWTVPSPSAFPHIKKTLQWLKYLHVPLLDLLQYVCFSLLLESPELHRTATCPTRASKKGRVASLDLLAIFFLMQPKRLLASLQWGHIAEVCSTCPPGPPGYFLKTCFPASWDPSL